MKMKMVKQVKRGNGWTVYKMDGRYYLDLHREITHSYASIQGIAEALYYFGYIDEKSAAAFWNK